MKDQENKPRSRAMNEPYLLRKCGMYYAHNSRGYTQRWVCAELYTKDYAEEHAKSHDEVQAVPLTEAANDREAEEYIERLEIVRDYFDYLRLTQTNSEAG